MYVSSIPNHWLQLLADMLHCLIEEASYTATVVATCVFVVPIRLSAGYIL